MQLYFWKPSCSMRMTIEGSLKFVYWFAIRKLGLLVCHSKIVFSIRGILHSVESFSLSHIALLYGCIWSVNLAGSNSVQIDLNIYRAAVRVIWLKSTLSKHPLSCTLEALGLPKNPRAETAVNTPKTVWKTWGPTWVPNGSHSKSSRLPCIM